MVAGRVGGYRAALAQCAPVRMPDPDTAKGAPFARTFRHNVRLRSRRPPASRPARHDSSPPASHSRACTSCRPCAPRGRGDSPHPCAPSLAQGHACERRPGTRRRHLAGPPQETAVACLPAQRLVAATLATDSRKKSGFFLRRHRSRDFSSCPSLEFAQTFSTFINCGVKRKDANALSRVAPNSGRRPGHLESAVI